MEPLTDNDISWLKAARITPPQVLVKLVDRPEVRESLRQALVAKLTLVISPAGFGKTTLLTQWRASLPEHEVVAGWVSLDEDDGEPLYLLSSMVLALSKAGADMGELEKTAATGMPEVPLALAVSRFLGAIAATPRQVLLILDDYHEIQGGAADSLIELLLSRSPDNFHLILCGRERPGLSLLNLKARGLLHEVGPEDLRFSEEHARDLIGGLLDGKSVRRLVERTEGWGVALQLARLWLEGAAGRADLIEGFSGRMADVADYLAEQVFNDLPEDTQTVLLETSICERINGDLVNTLTGRSDGWDMLLELEHFKALLIALDSERQWFRCHFLFRDFLLDQLQRRHPARVCDLHALASQWFEQREMRVDAVRHARMIEDYDRVADLIDKAGGWEMVLYGEVLQLRSLLRLLPPEIIQRYPALYVAQAYLYVKDGMPERAKALFDAAGASETAQRDDLPYRTKRDLVLIGNLFDGYEDQWLTSADYRRLEGLKDVIAADDHMGLGCYYEILAVVALRLGRGDEVEHLAIQAVRHMRAANSVLGLNYAYYHLGQAQIFSGQLRAGEATLREAMATAVENFGVDSGQKAIADVLLGNVLYLKGDLDAAAAHVGEAMEQVANADSWYDVLLSGYEVTVATAFMRSGLAAAQAVLDQGEQTARRRGLLRLHPFLQALRVRYHVLAGAIPQAAVLAKSADFNFTLGEWREKSYVWRVHHNSGLALASLYLAQGHPGDAFTILDDIRAAAEAGGRGLHIIQAGVLSVMALRLTGRHEEAVESLLGILRMALPEGLTQVFLEESAGLEGLLTQALRQQRETVDSLAKMQIAALLDVMRNHRLGPAPQPEQDVLSGREREVLNELANGYSNKEIARALNMTENTVKFHLKNIYSKLGVEKRGQAVARARELLLLDKN